MKQIYICAGLTTGPEVYRSHFTHFGFRYISLAGFSGPVTESTLTAHFIHSAVPQSGQFSSSSATLNAVQHATRYAALSNLMDVPTDCPQVGPRGLEMMGARNRSERHCTSASVLAARAPRLAWRRPACL